MNMKKINLTYLLLLAMALHLSACSQKENKPMLPKTVTPTENTELTETITTESETSYDTLLPYPIFNNITNVEEVNQMVVDYVTQLQDYNNFENALNLNYEIMYQDENYISIYFTGNITSGAYPRLFKATLNIDINQICRLTLNDITQLDDDFNLAFTEAAESVELKLGVSVIPDNILEMLPLTDYDGKFDYQSYFTSEEVVIIVSAIHAAGDYVIIRIPNITIHTHLI